MIPPAAPSTTTATLPPLGTAAEMIDTAARITTGEASRATADGASHVPMALPAAAQVTAVQRHPNCLPIMDDNNMIP